ncbi:Iron-containing redox enzyme [Variovorax sp. YR752]|uniref:iron-containing redox enzyme family protein n=1 Tax=Variovorax sp. YR752 TaxID=1884383 RepID=UPI000BCE6DC0|nr:iron-containing redox enzyme family protein [Variovorax sp. YR752]SOD25708.1 Iron-containing redox enzyme [Variovorax sp. YR752]
MSPDDTPDANTQLHRHLARFNAERLRLGSPSPQWQDDLAREHACRLLEGKYLEALRATVQTAAAASAGNAGHFIGWFESLAHTGPGQHHPLFDWLADEATLPQMRWFLTQEAAGEAGFEDLLAYTQVKLPPQPKLECARNFWDEMGHGKQSAMHGQMLEHMVRELDLHPAIDTTVWESLALANTMVGLATTRRYGYHSIGALGVIELTAPGRVKQVATGMRRLGLSGRARSYFDLHAALDVSHSRAWNREVIRPLVEADPACGQFIAEGALMRLVCGERCFERYTAELRHAEEATAC